MADVPDSRSRLSPSIVLTTPSGISYEASWIGDNITMEKRIQRDGFPLVAGQFGKDLGSTSDDYVMSIFFTGINCDYDAQHFRDSCREIGLWDVKHPVKGRKKLLLISLAEKDLPVESAGIVEFELKWFEPLDLLESTPELTSLVAGLAEQTVPVVATAFDTSTLITSFGAAFGVLGAATIARAIFYNVVNGVSWMISIATSLAELSRDKWDQANTDFDTEVATAEEDPDSIDPAAISTALTEMMMATTYGNEDSNLVMSNMEAFADEVIGSLPSGTFTGIAQLNQTVVFQAAMEGAIIAACYGMAYGERETRAEALDASQRITTLFENLTNALDAIAGYFSGLRADRQYYAQTETYGVMLNLVTQTKRMLQSQIFNLSIEKIFTLDRDKTPIQICFEEYKEKGEEYFDSFIQWNELEGDEINLLNAGREVKVYIEAR